jgi:NADH:ubiquinone oxidoreductase subunit 5 (subunit L)/multisubunit Na+/H+ antiporter MnhA subunit
MQFLLLFTILIPLCTFFISLIYKNEQEKSIVNTTLLGTSLQSMVSIGLALFYFINNSNPLYFNVIKIYHSTEFHFGFDLFYDSLSSIYLIVASFLFFIISHFSKTYMHRESGFKRFYNHLLLFFIGINILIMSGNFETLFLGWEIVGISSFLLISFYRERFLPVKNAMKVLSFYRIGDVALIGGIWFCHHLFNKNIQFRELYLHTWINSTHANWNIAFLISILFIIAASIKSAQFPFSIWLPRAMEGPTVSSAIFYGSVSIHIGVFLLIRTAPIWSLITSIKIILFSIGFITAIISYFTGAVQASAKLKIAYASICQIGLIFIEISLGWYSFAMIHFACNAFLRAYQLLASPSAMSYLIHQQFFNYKVKNKASFSFIPQRLRNTLYMLSIKEFSFDYIWYKYAWMPSKKVGKSFHFLRNKIAEAFFIILMLLGIVFYILLPEKIGFHYVIISWIYGIIGLILILIAWTERRSATRAWLYITLSQVFFMLSIAQQHTFQLNEIALYISGTLGAFLCGYWCLIKLISVENSIDLNQFHGHIYEHPKYALLFLVSALTMIGFPISPSFVGFDILISDIDMHDSILLILSAATFIILELAVIRIYARVFLGQHTKTYHEIAYRSS